MKKNNRGFTLVELLATIAILGLVVSITVFTGIRLIKNGREKTYQTTKSNIEKYAGNYLIENSDRLFYLSDSKAGIEYQCVTLKNLIDTGYFDTKLFESKVAEGISPKENDYVYIERNINTKTVMKNVYIQSSDNEYKETCDGAVKAEMDIAFLGDFDSWGKTKDITIIYKLKNANNINDYEYGYEYSNDKIELLKDNGNEKVVRVSDNGTLIGMINYLGEKAYEDSIIIDMIDNDGPIITLGDYKKGYVKESIDIILKVSDERAGVDSNSFSKEDIEVTVGGNKVTDLSLTDTGNGNYKLTINNDKLDGEVTISISAGKVLDKLGNGNESVKFDPDIKFDNTPPSKPVIDNPSKENWINSSFGLTLHTKEEGSGVDHWQYTYNGNNSNASSIGSNHSNDWVVYSNSAFEDFTTSPFSAERDQLVYVIACDKAGNCSNKSSTYIRIDKTKPTCSININPSGYAKEVTLTVSGKDTRSGLVDSPYSWDSESNGYGTEDTKKVATNGTYTAWVKDKAGNTNSCNVTVNNIDSSIPVITLGNYTSGYVRKSTEVNLIVKASTTGADINYDSFTIDDIVVTVGGTTVSGSTLTNLGSGNYKLAINNSKYDGKVVISIGDNKVLNVLNAGNKAVKFDPDITFDNTAPSKPVINNPSNENWMNSNFGLTLNTQENGSGMANWQYTYNGSANNTGSNHNNDWVVYSESDKNSFTTSPFSAERNQLVYVRACDKAGNCSDKSSTYIRIDKTKPTGEISLSENSKTITGIANVSDALSGLSGTYEWKVDTDATCDSTVSGFVSSSSSTYEVTVSGTGTYYACLKVSDKAGNVAYFSQQVNVAEELSCWYLNGYNTYCRYEPNMKKGGDNIYSQKRWNSNTKTYYYSQKLWESGTYFNIDGWTYGTDDKGNGNSTIWYHSKTYNCYLISTYLKERQPRGSCPGWNGNAADGWANCTCNTDADCGNTGNVITILKCDKSMKSGKTEKDGKYMCVWRVGTSNQYNTCW